MAKRGITNGADALVATLEDLGVRCVFGLPGSQNIRLFESLRSSGIRTVLTTSEMTAGFMANGWFRGSGQPAVYLAIPGPGFVWAVPPLAEALQDSAASILITGKPPDRGYMHDIQFIRQREIAAALDVPVFDVDSLDELPRMMQVAWSASIRNGPRPVVMQVPPALLAQDWMEDDVITPAAETESTSFELPQDLIERLTQATLPVVFAGGGSLAFAQRLEQLINATGAALLTTPTARGVIPESHPLCLGADFACHGSEVINRFLASSDLVVALGCRFSHNGTDGFRLVLDESKLVHVDIDVEVLQANYPSRWPLCVDVGQFLDAALQVLSGENSATRTGWQSSDIDNWRDQLQSSAKSVRLEPVWKGQGDCKAIFHHIRSATPDDGIFVTDTGNHQFLARAYLEILGPRGLILPSDFQSMGFGLPAAIGAALSSPGRSVVALIGDGSLMMVGTELLTARIEEIPLPVLVFCDGSLGLIRTQQIEKFGHDTATQLAPVDLAAFADSLGIDYVLGADDLDEQIRLSFSRSGPTIIEIQLEDCDSLKGVRRKVLLKNKIKAKIGPKPVRFLKRLRR